MSRTDAHRPYPVRLADEPGDRIEVHHHEHGTCTLPDDVRELGEWRSCHYAGAWHLTGTCGCRMCTGHHQRHWANRGRRVAEQALVRAATRNAAETELETLEARANARARRW